MINFKKIIAIIFAILLLLTIAFYSYKLSNPVSVSYTGLSDTGNLSSTSRSFTSEAVVSKDGVTRNIIVANDPSFDPRSVTAGGETPTGWLASLTETQPKVFTGKLLYKNGLENYDLFLQESEDFFTGEAKSIKDKTVTQLSMQKQNNLCKDSEGNTYEYTVIASFNGENLSGCGGKVVEVKK